MFLVSLCGGCFSLVIPTISARLLFSAHGRGGGKKRKKPSVRCTLEAGSVRTFDKGMQKLHMYTETCFVAWRKILYVVFLDGYTNMLLASAPAFPCKFMDEHKCIDQIPVMHHVSLLLGFRSGQILNCYHWSRARRGPKDHQHCSCVGPLENQYLVKLNQPLPSFQGHFRATNCVE